MTLHHADALRSDQWAGCFHGMKVAALWGNPPVAKIAQVADPAARSIDRFMYLDTIDLNERSHRGLCSRAGAASGRRSCSGTRIRCTCWRAFVLEQQISDLRPRGIISTSMMLLANERRVIEEAFGCKVTDRYGCEEVGLIACECEQHEGLHLDIEHLYIEFLRPDGTAAAPGEEGAIVITDLLNRGMPFIRYRIEDIGVPSERALLAAGAACRSWSGSPGASPTT